MVRYCGVPVFKITLFIRESPKRVLSQTVKTQMKCSIMLPFIKSTLFVKVKKILRQKNAIFFKIII